MNKYFHTIFVFFVCAICCHAQVLLPLEGSNVSISPCGVVELEFTDPNQGFLLCGGVDWKDYDSYIIYFNDLTETTLKIGNDEIPRGVRSFQGFKPAGKYISWEATNGEEFSEYPAWLKISSDSPVKIRINDFVLCKKDGSLFRPLYSFDTDVSFLVDFEATNGEEFEEWIGADDWKEPYRVTCFSGEVLFENADSYVGGTKWAGKAEERLLYRLELNKPVETSNFAWKYLTKSGDLRYQRIAPNTLVSELASDDDIVDCSIVRIIDDESEKALNVKKVSIEKGTLYGPGMEDNDSIAYKRADVNGDGSVDVADISSIINVMASMARKVAVEE